VLVLGHRTSFSDDHINAADKVDQLTVILQTGMQVRGNEEQSSDYCGRNRDAESGRIPASKPK
jgi:hypothetical protein